MVENDRLTVITVNLPLFLFPRGVMQGTLVRKLTLGPFLTLSVRNGHKLKDWVFFGALRISRENVDNKNYNQYFIEHDEDNNSQI